MNHVPEVQIHEGELQFISDCVLRYPNLETGGDFFGFWSRDGDPVIQYVIGPGEQTTRTGTSFFQDIDYLKLCGTALHSLHALEHIGAWHSHHGLNLFNPSAGDVQTMRNALRRPYPTRFLIAICNIVQNSTVSLGCFLFARDNTDDYLVCKTHILPGNSPIRENLRGNNRANTQILETIQKLSSPENANPARVTLRNYRDSESNSKNKPAFSEGSFWSTREGHKHLKAVFDKLGAISEVSSLEIKQLCDSRPAISFTAYGTIFEIRFPDDFPVNVPEVIMLNTPAQGASTFFRKAPRSPSPAHLNAVQQIINSLRMLPDDRQIPVRE